MEWEQGRGSGADLTRIATWVYGSLTVFALGWLSFHSPDGMLAALIDPNHLRRDLLLGLGAALVVATASRFLTRALETLRYVEEELGRWLGPLSAGMVARLAILSGIGEELFFRGVLLPELGLLWSALLFGVLHIGPDVRFLTWTAAAFLSGLLLGWMTLETGSLLAPIVAHVVINYLGLLVLAKGRETGQHNPESVSADSWQKLG